MRDEQIEQHFQFIRQQISALRGKNSADWKAIDAALEDLQVSYEQMQTNLGAVEVVETELIQQKQYYQDLFQFFPIASLVTDANGLIREANQAIAQLLNLPQTCLVGRPLVTFVAERDQTAFRTRLIELSQSSGIQVWTMSLCPWEGEPILVKLHIAIVHRTDGLIEQLRIGVYNVSQSQTTVASVIARTSISHPHRLEVVPAPLSPFPQPLDGLRVLIVDDEVDIREFVSTVLESHGIGVKTVANVAAALEELERFHPDVLLSDIRLPGEDGYSLIRRIRALESQRGGHLPAVAMTAYLDEDREKTLQAGFEAHLYKLVQPSKWVEMVAQLAKQSSNSEPEF